MGAYPTTLIERPARRARQRNDWTDAQVARLRELWAEGHSTAEIGRRMGVSKNAVVGRAHRLGLPSRPSPIRQRTGHVVRRPRAVRGRDTLAVLAVLAVAPAAAVAVVAPRALAGAAELEAARLRAQAAAKAIAACSAGPAAAQAFRLQSDTGNPVTEPAQRVRGHGFDFRRPDGAAPIPTVRKPPSGTRHPCSWPIGEPRTRGFRFCDEPGEPGRSYCAAHCAIAYRRVGEAA